MGDGNARKFNFFLIYIIILQLESSSQENLQQLESLQEAKNALEEQLKKETAAKVAMMSGCEVYLHLL